MLTEDLHTHTIYSHGKGTVEESVLAAIQCGLRRIGIAEHGPRHVFFPVKWPALLQLRQEVDHMNSRYGDKITVVMGLEANLIGDGLTDVPEDTSIFDYLMLGYHKGVRPVDAIGRRWLRAFLFRQRKSHAEENAMAYMHAMDRLPADAQRKLINITHPGTYIPVDIPLLARAAAERGITLELNESHHSMDMADIAAARQQNALLYISSDAHRPEDVGKATSSIALARDAGVLPFVKNWAE